MSAVSVLLGCGLSPSSTFAASAATGMIEGRIFNPRSGTMVEGARISVENTSLVTFSDADGIFRLSDVPAGTAQLRIFYTGFTPQLESVAVAAGQRVERDITLATGRPDTLKPDEKVVKLDQFVVGETREMEAAAIAINEQRFAPNVKTVVSTDEFGAVAEGNVAEFLRYLPGLTVDLSGGDARTVSIDGAPAENTPVTFGGLSLSSPTGTGRAVEVGFFNLNNISRIEVSMSPTPDSPGSALAGSVNLPAVEERRRVAGAAQFLRAHQADLQRQRVPDDARRSDQVRRPGRALP